MNTPTIGRRIEDCPHRSVDHHAPASVARCDLLPRITGIPRSELYEVSPDVCQTCCNSFQPTAEAPNAVIASLLFRVAESILEDPAQSSAASSLALQIMQQAEAALPLSYPDEEDVAVWPPTFLANRHDDQPIEALLPVPRRRCGPPVSRWAVGVTTAPRQLATLEYCLESLAITGWTSPRLFVDGPVPLPNRFAAVPLTQRDRPSGAWPNFYLGLAELAMRDPDADAYLMVQDDAVLYAHSGLRAYLEQILWPGDEDGIVSLFCSREYTQPLAGWHRFCGCWRLGALAYIFSRRVVQRLLADPQVVLHRWKGEQGLVAIDTVVGRWAEENHVPLFFPTPSLVQHIGHMSTLWPSVSATGIRAASVFAGDPTFTDWQRAPDVVHRTEPGRDPLTDEMKLSNFAGDDLRDAHRFTTASSVEKSEVTVGGQRFSDSLLMQGPAQLTYVLDGRFQEFEASVSVRPLPDARPAATEFIVLADEVQVAISPPLQPESPPVRLTARIGGARVLKLVVNSSGWEPCQALWLSPVVRVSPLTPAATLTDCLQRAVMTAPTTLPPSRRCIATVASPGFEDMLAEMLHSLAAYGNCPDAQMIVVLAGRSSACQALAAKYGAAIVPCEPLREPNATLKSVLYSIPKVVSAEQFLCLDVDTLILGDLNPIFECLNALPEQSVLACREANRYEFRDLKHALSTVYDGAASDLQRLQITPEEGSYPLVINDGVFAGSRAALLNVDYTLQAIPHAIEWMDEKPEVSWRNQFLFNLALARLNAGVELAPMFNAQMNYQDVAIMRSGSQTGVMFSGKPARIVHFNGLGRYKHRDFRRGFRHHVIDHLTDQRTNG
jgi:hypothetical protein